MTSIPLDVLREILEHVGKAELVVLCQVSKVCCYFSQDVLYRKILVYMDTRVIRTLAQSTDLARRVRSFESHYFWPELPTALHNMSSLRTLILDTIDDPSSILDGCTFKLDSFACNFPYDESLRKFLNSQPGLTNLRLHSRLKDSSAAFDDTCLPNLTQVTAYLSWLRSLVPGRPVKKVMELEPYDEDDIGINFFTLSTAPIQKLSLNYYNLYPKTGSFMVSMFPSLVHLAVDIFYIAVPVRRPPLY